MEFSSRLRDKVWNGKSRFEATPYMCIPTTIRHSSPQLFENHFIFKLVWHLVHVWFDTPNVVPGNTKIVIAVLNLGSCWHGNRFSIRHMESLRSIIHVADNGRGCGYV